jgi:hypothetical protein
VIGGQCRPWLKYNDKFQCFYFISCSYSKVWGNRTSFLTIVIIFPSVWMWFWKTCVVLQIWSLKCSYDGISHINFCVPFFYKHTLVNKFDIIWIGIISYVVLNGCNGSINATNTNKQAWNLIKLSLAMNASS